MMHTRAIKVACTDLMDVNLAIIQPQGYIHSLCFLDTARFLRHHLRKRSIEAHITKNRVEQDRVNIVFGAHLGVPPEWDRTWTYLWFNQEQLGSNGADLSREYVDLLRSGHVLDYDPANLQAYDPARVRGSNAKSRLTMAAEAMCTGSAQRQTPLRLVVPLRDAPFMRSVHPPIAIEDRPIDLLFFGSLNDYRIELINRIQGCGIEVSRFDHPMYGPERDAYIAQAKAVLNIPFYGTNRFEQVRAFNCLSLGTPVVSLRRPGLIVDTVYEDSVHWFEEAQLEAYFCTEFLTEPWHGLARQKIAVWSQQPEHGIDELVESIRRLDAERQHQALSRSKGRVTRLNLDEGRQCRTGWINVGRRTAIPATDRTQAPHESNGLSKHLLTLEPNSLEAATVTHDLNDLQGTLNLLEELEVLMALDGQLQLDAPLGIYEEANESQKVAQEQTLARLRYLMDEHMRFGKASGLLHLERLEWVQEDSPTSAGTRLTARMHFRKRECTPRESVIRRSYGIDFGELPEDYLEPLPNLTPMHQHSAAEV